MKKTLTKGNIVVEDIKIGDIHYEFEYNIGMKLEVITLPEKNESGQWVWSSRNLKSGNIVNYLVTPGLEHYGPNLYDYEAYSVKSWI